MQSFVEELSNWYVRRSRSRFWAKGMEQDKVDAYMTLYTALVTTVKAAAPMVPFITESIYRNLVCSVDKTAPISVHLADFPTVNEAFIDTQLEENMEIVLEVVTLGRAARNAANIKNRQPVARMFIKAEHTLPEFFVEIIEDELNVKAVTFRDDMSDFLSYHVKPNFRVLGAKVGKQMNAVKKALEESDGAAVKDALAGGGSYTLHLTDGDVTVTSEDVEVTVAQQDGYNCQSYGGVTVALETTLTEELLEEGFVREIISKVQTMRKECGLEVTDHIVLDLSGNAKLTAIAAKNEAFIREITLADSVSYDAPAGTSKEWNINGEKLTISIK